MSEQGRQKDLADIRRLRRERVEQLLHEDVTQRAPGNAAYWAAVVGGAFALNLLLLVLVAR